METTLHHPQSLAKEQNISFQDYLKAYNSVEGMRTEWNAGEVESYKTTNNLQHQRLIGFLVALLGYFLDRDKLGEVILAGFPMYLSDDKPAREPDLMVILNDHRDRLKPTYLDGIADLVVEVVSPESDERDHGKKLLEYEAAGIPVYWLIDPLRREVDVYVLGDDQRYHRVAGLTSGVLHGFVLDPQILWQESLPDGATLLALVEQMDRA
jgi:Uma2 family endonuclease